ncbi:hypothetical protein Tco_0593975 [Tanacetum coccineum]|uniref:Uncharacterized protein n=1 Tax=Tanacetum coccineum TaxID=301880 RepID=A0ABQ4XLE4_9ASTR
MSTPLTHRLTSESTLKVHLLRGFIGIIFRSPSSTSTAIVARDEVPYYCFVLSPTHVFRGSKPTPAESFKPLARGFKIHTSLEEAKISIMEVDTADPELLQM